MLTFEDKTMTIQDILSVLEIHNYTIVGNNYNISISLAESNLNSNIAGDLFLFYPKGDLTRKPEIELPKGTIKDIYNHAEKFDTFKLCELMKFIYKNVPESRMYSQPLVYVCFSVLHEMGHALHLDKMLTPDEYILIDSREKQLLEERKNVMDEKELFYEYRKCTCEIEADKFAFKFLVDVLKELEKN